MKLVYLMLFMQFKTSMTYGQLINFTLPCYKTNNSFKYIQSILLLFIRISSNSVFEKCLPAELMKGRQRKRDNKLITKLH